jgi:hypothetical protein
MSRIVIFILKYHCQKPRDCILVMRENFTWTRGGEWRHSSTILNLGTSWWWGASFTTQRLHCRKERFVEGIHAVTTRNCIPIANSCDFQFTAATAILCLLRLLCLQQSLPYDGSKQCFSLPCPRSERQATLQKLTHCQNQVTVILRLTWCQTLPWDLRTIIRFFYSSLDNCGLVDVGFPTWRKDESVVYSCCGASPEQSLWGPSPAGLMTMFYC